MSEEPQKVQETPAADPAAVEPTTTATEASKDPIRPTGTDTLTPESRPEVTAATESPVPVTEPKTEKVSGDAVKIEAQPMSEGVLGYKAPGLLKSLRFSKNFFWFNDEAVDPQQLSTYLRGEKPEIGHPTAAYASQTGKGLMFFAKRAEDKPQPSGILNLSEASDVTKENFDVFSLKLHGHKHSFQAQSQKDRDSWLVAIQSKAAEAKSAREGVVGSDGYKSRMKSFADDVEVKPATATAAPVAAAKAAAQPKKSGEGNTQERDSETTNDTAGEGTQKKADKSRSQSRKRASIFGTFLGKKDEHDEKKEAKAEEKAEDKAAEQELKKEEKTEKKELKAEEKADKEEEKAEVKVEKEEQKEEKKAEKEQKKDGVVDPAPLDAVAVASRATKEPEVSADGSKSASTADTAPKSSKRNSVFGGFFNKKDTPKKDVAPAVPPKDDESGTAPKASEPTDTSPANAAEGVTDTPAATETPAPTSTTPTQKTPQTESKGGLFGFIKSKEAQHEEKKEEKAEEKTEKKGEEPAAAAGTPAASGDAPTASTPAETAERPSKGTATTPDPAKDKRRSSFFSTLGTKKEKKADATSDAEGTDGEGKKSASGKLGDLFRKTSRAARGGKSSSEAPGEKTAEPPVPTSKDTAAAEPDVTSTGEAAEEPKADSGAVKTDIEKAGEPLEATGPEPATVSQHQPTAVSTSA